MKFTLVLFTVLSAVVLSGTQAFSIQEKLGNVREKVDGFIENSIKKSRDAISAAQDKSAESIKELKGKVAEFVQRAEAQLAGVLQKVDEKVSEALSALDNPSTECQKLAGTVRDTAVSTVANVTRCVSEKQEVGLQYVKNILAISEKVTAELEGLPEEALQCTKGVDGIRAIVGAIICVNKVGAKAAAVSAKAIPEVSANSAQLGKIISTFRATAEECATTTGYDSLAENMNDLLDGVEECVKEALESDKKQS